MEMLIAKQTLPTQDAPSSSSVAKSLHCPVLLTDWRPEIQSNISLLPTWLPPPNTLGQVTVLLLYEPAWQLPGALPPGLSGLFVRGAIGFA